MLKLIRKIRKCVSFLDDSNNKSGIRFLPGKTRYKSTKKLMQTKVYESYTNSKKESLSGEMGNIIFELVPIFFIFVRIRGYFIIRLEQTSSNGTNSQLFFNSEYIIKRLF